MDALCEFFNIFLEKNFLWTNKPYFALIFTYFSRYVKDQIL